MTAITTPQAAPVRALCFDIFGTVVDWYGSICAELVRIGLPVDAAEFTLAWRAGYQPAMAEVRAGRLPWTNIDGLHRRILDRLLAERGVGLPEAEAAHLNRIWHRLDPWPDVVEGLQRLKRRHTITTLSNGNFSLLTAMAKNAGLPWDCIVSAELFKHYKPDPETYHGVAGLLNLPIEQVMLCASHPSDLRAAKAQGMRTAYVMRPFEFGEHVPLPKVEAGEFDFVAQDFVDLARQLAT